MRIRVRLFAILRERAGWRERELELPSDSSIEDAWQAMVDLSPALGPSRESVRFARNRQYAASDERLADGDELALIPPVAGGASNSGGDLLRCELREQLIEDEILAELRATVPTPADGALVIFVGQTRETAGTPAPGEEAAAATHQGELVTGLDYEAFEEMALETLRTIGAEIGERFGVRRLAMIHRVGRVAVGEPSVVIAAAAAHRSAAFDATRYAIEELKARAPIWKAEHFADGSVWIGAPAREGPPPTESSTE
jgi:molybdopterin converting factor subunit 1